MTPHIYTWFKVKRKLNKQSTTDHAVRLNCTPIEVAVRSTLVEVTDATQHITSELTEDQLDKYNKRLHYCMSRYKESLGS